MVGPQSSLSSLFPAHQGSLLQRSTQTEAFQEAPQWVPDSPLGEGPEQTMSVRRLPVSSVHSPGQVLLSAHCVSAGTSLCQPAREAHYPSAATLTVSNSPAHASQAGQGQSPHRPGPGKHPRRGQHYPLHMCHGLLCPGQERPETAAPGIFTQAHVRSSVLEGQ